MKTDKPLVKNAADSKQVKAAKNKEKDLRYFELEDIRKALRSEGGRKVFWRILEYCHVFSSVKDNNALNMSYNSGQQDVGHFIMSEILEADENLFFKMQVENKKRKEDNV
jgi:hypothetical protein